MTAISIHAPRVKGDGLIRPDFTWEKIFQSTPPCVGVTQALKKAAGYAAEPFSIHAPSRVGSDFNHCGNKPMSAISIHAPMGGDAVMSSTI